MGTNNNDVKIAREHNKASSEDVHAITSVQLKEIEFAEKAKRLDVIDAREQRDSAERMAAMDNATALKLSDDSTKSTAIAMEQIGQMNMQPSAALPSPVRSYSSSHLYGGLK